MDYTAEQKSCTTAYKKDTFTIFNQSPFKEECMYLNEILYAWKTHCFLHFKINRLCLNIFLAKIFLTELSKDVYPFIGAWKYACLFKIHGTTKMILEDFMKVNHKYWHKIVFVAFRSFFYVIYGLSFSWNKEKSIDLIYILIC